MSPPPSADETARARPGLVILACLAGFVGGQIVAVVLNALLAAAHHYPGGLSALANAARPPWWSNAASLVGLWCGFAAAVGFAQSRRGLEAWPERWALRWGDALYLALGVLCQGLIAVLYAPFHPQNLGRPVHHLFDSTSGATLVLLGALTVVGAPLMEEWFFRGVLYRALASVTSGWGRRAGSATAILASALLFALAHGERVQFAGLAVLGVVLAYLVHRTNRLMPSVLTHVSFNAVAFTALLAQRAGH